MINTVALHMFSRLFKSRTRQQRRPPRVRILSAEEARGEAANMRQFEIWAEIWQRRKEIFWEVTDHKKAYTIKRVIPEYPYGDIDDPRFLMFEVFDYTWGGHQSIGAVGSADEYEAVVRTHAALPNYRRRGEIRNRFLQGDADKRLHAAARRIQKAAVQLHYRPGGPVAQAGWNAYVSGMQKRLGGNVDITL